MCEALGQPKSLLSLTSETTDRRISHPITHPVAQNVSVTPAALLERAPARSKHRYQDRESNTLPGICFPASKHFLPCRTELCLQHVWLQDPAIGKSGTFFSPQLKDAFYNLVFLPLKGLVDHNRTESGTSHPRQPGDPFSQKCQIKVLPEQQQTQAWLDLSNSHQRGAKILTSFLFCFLS